MCEGLGGFEDIGAERWEEGVEGELGWAGCADLPSISGTPLLLSSLHSRCLRTERLTCMQSPTVVMFVSSSGDAMMLPNR